MVCSEKPGRIHRHTNGIPPPRKSTLSTQERIGFSVTTASSQNCSSNHRRKLSSSPSHALALLIQTLQVNRDPPSPQHPDPAAADRLAKEEPTAAG